jgi:glycosyltransferase involved in cell wall biosynthesis
MPVGNETQSSVSIGVPLVSVGIPTYNRPEGIRRTLKLICGQTYQNIEIIVSDNASPDPRTKLIVDEFALKDQRIQYFRQASNIGAGENFRFVLAKAAGDYFMWAADDDEWDPTFIEACVSEINPTCSVMTQFSTKFRKKNVSQYGALPELVPNENPFENVKRYFCNMQPTLLYGLHPKNAIKFFLQGRTFDFYDCYVVLRLILESDIRILSQRLFSAGIDAPEYEIKYVNRSAGKKRLRFFPFFAHSAFALIRCSRVSIFEKASLLLILSRLIITLRRHHSGSRA